MEAFRMITLAFGAIPAQAVRAAATLGIADDLADGPRTVAELASATGTHAGSLGRLLHALVTLDVLAAEPDGRFRSTPLGDTLRSGVPGSVRQVVMTFADSLTTRAACEIEHSLRTGEPAFDEIFGAPFFDYLAAHPDDGARFDAGMACFSEMENPGIAAAYDFPAGARVVDVGGGRGGFIAEVLKAHPTVRGVLYDQPQVVRDATYVADAGVAARCEIVSGDMFASVPKGADFYVVKRILHDWSDDVCVALLSRIRAAMPAGGRVLAVDAVLGPPGHADPNRISDILMLVLLRGRERTEEDFRALFKAAGLRLVRVIPTPSALAIVEGAAA